MKKDTIAIKEFTIIGFLFLIFFLLLNPFGWWMPTMMLTGLLIIGLAIFGLFAALTVKEEHSDEREAHHRVAAGRAAFVVGTTILAIAMVVQSVRHAVDPWLFVTFVAMITAKIASRSYIDKKY